MSTFVPRDVECARCGVTTRRQVATSLNPTRSLAHVAALELGAFQTWPCPECGQLVEVDDPFLFTDLEGDLLVAQLPADWETEWPHHEEVVRAMWRRNAGDEAPPLARSVLRRAMCRVVFGLDALREKVLIHGAGLDDALVEAVKLDLVRSDPRLAIGPGFRPRLAAARDDKLTFTVPLAGPGDDTPMETERVSVPLAAYRAITAERARWRALLDHFDGALYVDLGRLFFGS
jgi:hypothetical protein